MLDPNAVIAATRSEESIEPEPINPTRLLVRDRFPSNTEDPPLVVGHMPVNRIDKHDRHKSVVATEIRGQGLDVVQAEGAGSFDLLVDDSVRVALRVAYPGMRRHRVTVGGRTYRYKYETWHFNFHHHGRLDERYTDFFACIAKDPVSANKDRTFVIPWASVSGKTFSLHGGRGTYRGRYAPFLGAWEAIHLASGANRNDVSCRLATDPGGENFWLGSGISTGPT